MPHGNTAQENAQFFVGCHWEKEGHLLQKSIAFSVVSNYNGKGAVGRVKGVGGCCYDPESESDCA